MMITCIKCGITLCHEAESLPMGAELDDDGYAVCAACVKDAANNFDPTDAQLNLSGDSGGVPTEQSLAYRTSLRDAGRGGLLR